MTTESAPSSPVPSTSLKGRTALVTGSTKGLGRAMATALGAAGAKVAFNYANSKEHGERALAEFQDLGFEGGLFQADVTDEQSVNQLVADIGEQLGPVDIVVVNATPDQPQMPIEEYDWDFYQSMLDFFV